MVDVPQKDLFELWQTLEKNNLARAHIGFITDIICCPGGDFCSLANAKSIPISEAITRRFDDLDTVYNLGHIDLNISGCMNACGHHHVGNIGILGVDKKGAEFYQITLGGNADHDASIGDILGPSFAAESVPDIIDEILNTYLDLRTRVKNLLKLIVEWVFNHLRSVHMLNTALQVLSKDGTVADNTYQIIAEDGVLPQGDVLLTVEQLDQLANVTGKKALFLTVDASPEINAFPLDQLDAIFIDFAGFNDGRGYSFAALVTPPRLPGRASCNRRCV